MSKTKPKVKTSKGAGRTHQLAGRDARTGRFMPVPHARQKAGTSIVEKVRLGGFAAPRG